MRSVVSLLSSVFASSTAMALLSVALGKLVFDITDSELALGLLGLAEFAPALVLVFVTGPARRPPRPSPPGLGVARARGARARRAHRLREHRPHVDAARSSCSSSGTAPRARSPPPPPARCPPTPSPAPDSPGSPPARPSPGRARSCSDRCSAASSTSSRRGCRSRPPRCWSHRCGHRADRARAAVRPVHAVDSTTTAPSTPACTRRWRACGSCAVVRSFSARSRSTCSRCCSAARSRCSPPSPRIGSGSVRSVSVGSRAATGIGAGVGRALPHRGSR